MGLALRPLIQITLDMETHLLYTTRDKQQSAKALVAGLQLTMSSLVLDSCSRGFC